MKTPRSEVIPIIVGMFKKNMSPSSKYIADSMGLKRKTADSYKSQAKEQYIAYLEGRTDGYIDTKKEESNEWCKGYLWGVGCTAVAYAILNFFI